MHCHGPTEEVIAWLEKHFQSAFFKSQCEVVMSCLGSENLIIFLATQVEQACDVAVKKKERNCERADQRVKEINHRWGKEKK